MAQGTEHTILMIARKHFVKKGYSGARMQEIADEAGINKAMLHYYFRSKEKLYKEIISQTLNMFVPKIAKALGQGGSVMERLEQVVETYIAVLTVQPDIPFFIMSELSQKREVFVEELKSRASHFEGVPVFFQQAQKEMEEGKIRKMPPHHLLLNVISLCVFPFLVRSVFDTVLELPDAMFDQIMNERKEIVMGFLKNALLLE